MVGLDPLLALLAQVVPPQQIPVPLDRELLEDLPHQRLLLGPEHLLHRVGALVLDPGQTERALFCDPACPLVVPRGEVSGECGDEGGQVLRIAHASRPDPLQEDAERLLMKVLADCAFARNGLEDGADAAAEALHQIPFRCGLPRADSLHECFQGIAQSDAILPFPTVRAVVATKR